MGEPNQQSLAAPAEMEGVGLHTGEKVRLRLLPADPGFGVRFRRTDLPGAPEVAARVEQVVATDRGTTLGAGDAEVHTVEHLLAAVAAQQIDNLLIELNASEPPAGDGSAQPFLDLIERAGIAEQSLSAAFIAPKEMFTVSEGSAKYSVLPADEFRVTATIRFPHPLIGEQSGSFRIEPDWFSRDMGRARTFGFLHEVTELRERARAIGGTLENCIVLTEDGVLEDRELRFPDEFLRHKALDVVGDLALLGSRLRAHVIAELPGHRGNVALAREILARERRSSCERPILDIQQILQYLPHRYPFLLVDRVIEYEERKRIVGLKNVTINEPFFVGHFPGHPTMPGVLIIEAMAQVGGLLMMDTIDNPDEKIVYFMTLDKVKWRRPVIPGDQIRFELEVIQIRGTTCRMKGVGTVEGKIVAEAEMMARVVDR